jgi:hypothetical protein
VSQRKRGYPSMEKQWVSQPKRGYPSMEKQWVSQPKRGYPSLENQRVSRPKRGLENQRISRPKRRYPTTGKLMRLCHSMASDSPSEQFYIGRMGTIKNRQWEENFLVNSSCR